MALPETPGTCRAPLLRMGGLVSYNGCESRTLEPPAYYEVLLLVRSFCDDLAERLWYVEDDNLPEIAAFLAWVDWQFQWVYPFKDFNGRIGRLVLAALLYKLVLPPVKTAPTDHERRREYREALRDGDAENLDPLQKLWIRRHGEAI